MSAENKIDSEFDRNNVLMKGPNDIRIQALMKEFDGKSQPIHDTPRNAGCYGKVIYLSCAADADFHHVYMKDNNGNVYRARLRPNSGIYGQDTWMCINSAYICGTYIDVYTDSNGDINYINLTPFK